MNTKEVLDQLFDKAGLERAVPGQPIDEHKQVRVAAALRHQRGELKAMRFAQLYVKHNLNPAAAYAEFTSARKHNAPKNKGWAWAYASHPLVLKFVRQIYQDSFEAVRDEARDDLTEMMWLNRVIMWGDITKLLQQTTEYQMDKEGNPIQGTRRTRTQMKPLEQIDRSERVLLKKITFKDGQVTGIEAYSRNEAMRNQIELLEIMHRRGGSDESFIVDLRKRLTVAREKRIDEEVRAGKVIRLMQQQEGKKSA